MKGINLNSFPESKLPEYIWNKIYGRLTYLTPVYERVPIYLVDEATMDRIHPPERSLSMDILKKRIDDIINRIEVEAERIRKELENKEKEKAQNNEAQRPQNRDQQTEGSRPENERERNREEELPRWASIIEEGLNACFTSQMSALGVYFHDFQPQPELADDLTKNLEERTKYDKALKKQILAQHPYFPAGEVIFICWNRVYRHKKPRLLFQKVVIHELAHAYVQGKRSEDYRRGYGRVIEESLANAVALSHFHRKETPALKAFIATQPPEYRGCYFWMDQPQRITPYRRPYVMYHNLEGWANKPVDLLLSAQFYDLIKDRRLPTHIFLEELYDYYYYRFLNLFPFRDATIFLEALEQNYEKDNHRPLCNLISLAILQFVAEQG